jgi:hypothetical protein
MEQQGDDSVSDLYKQFAKFDMGAAYIALSQSVETARHNTPIWEADGNPDQAAASKRQGDECEAAIKFISDRIGATP